MRRCLVIVCVCLAVTSCATAGASKQSRDEPAAGRFHTMQPGETVWDLARASGLSVEELVEVNGLPSADDVAAGQVLFVPAGGVDDGGSGSARERSDSAPATAGATASAAPAVLAWPVDGGGVVLRDFSTGKLAYDGLLIAAPEGTVVKAAADGSVVFAGDQGTAYGIIVVLQHAGDVVTVYGHLARADVKAGDKVTAGQALGAVGMSGGAETPRLHFQVRRGRTVVDPAPLLPQG